MGPRTLLIDGYNVIRTTPSLAAAESRGGLVAGREALLARLVAACARWPDEIVVVFDGGAPAETTAPLRGLSRGRAIFSRADDSADNVIKRLAREARALGRVVSVITNDGEVRTTAAAYGASPIRSDVLARRLNQAPKDLRQRQRHKESLQRRWDASESDGEPRARSRKGNPRQAPRRRRYEEPPL
ncbi:MAG: NYN domain-containing protein [Ktedonobacterales bacterium]|nr:NYN domain-containing protein [Ktedonobacterales bacterium]